MSRFGETQSSQSPSARHGVHGETRGTTIPLLLISDIHFDPFRDPSKVDQLTHAPVSEWKAILSSPASADDDLKFQALQEACQARGVDTSYSLFESSLQAMRAQQSDARFLTVSGDLLAHAFSCRYKTLLKGSTQAAYEVFVLKTISFVELELHESFPGRAVYVALGNNDSPCGDYRLDADSDFLAKTGRIIAEGLPYRQRQQVIEQYAHQGYFSLMMDGPMQGTRFIVLNDVFMSAKYTTCAGGANAAAATSELLWLRAQLTQARQARQTVWVMGHIPPGVDVYSTVAKLRDICGKEGPVMFLSSDELAPLLMEYGDVIRLGLFAHTHMDEMRLLEPATTGMPASTGHSVAIKMVPSVSPVDGNNPSFTVGRVNPFTATLVDYAVIAASNPTGVGTTWRKEYDYVNTYHQAAFSASALQKLIPELTADPKAGTEPSKVYLRSYFVGDRSQQLMALWPQYLCAVSNESASEFTKCACSVGKK